MSSGVELEFFYYLYQSDEYCSNNYQIIFSLHYILHIFLYGDSFLTKPGKNIFLARKIIKKITKVNPIFSTTGGTSDARFIKKIAPCLEFGLVNKTMHKVDECVSLKDLSNLKKIYYNFLLEFFK